MIFHENRLSAEDSHGISCLICYFQKGSKLLNCRLLQIIGGALSVKTDGLQLRLETILLICTFLYSMQYNLHAMLVID